ncbi:MAG TPA: endonuclease domain-containing protein [Candidatus Andersenbacteria bacterium]|nr:endonuclease domain-containing protein [Candidatus Andersenbacteria bacterium]
MGTIYNHRNTNFLRKILRNNMPQPELVLWKNIRGKQLGDYKFRRQFSVGNYILDFYCPKKKLSIEIDGDSHFSKQAINNDKIRQVTIEEFGILIIRFTNEEVITNIDTVVERIHYYLQQR